MTLKNHYRKVSPVIISFPAADIITGKGYIRYFGLDDVDGNYRLSDKVIDSHNYRVNVATSTDTSFDLLFEVTRRIRIKGDVFISWVTGSNPSVSNPTTVKIIYVAVGGGETELATATGKTTTSSTSKRQLAILNIDQSFILGEKFRVKINITPSGGSGFLFHDPTNRLQTANNDIDTGATNDTDLIVDVPFLAEEL